MIRKITMCGAALLFAGLCNAQTVTFNYTDSIKYYVVPTCVDSVYIQAWGAGGANSPDRTPTSHVAGKGAYATGTVAVTAGDTLWIYVGGAGDTSGTGGFNGGGKGGSSSHGGSCYGGVNAGGGGGASDVRLGVNILANRVIVAGGGGGAGRDYCNGSCQPCGCGGSGGSVTTNGLNGTAAFNCGFGYAGSGINYGSGGTQVAGGAGGPGDGGGTPGSSGSLGVGGAGSSGGTQDVAGGGGGGGYYGGGGGGGANNGSGVGAGGGGGGSSYITGLTNGTVTDSVQAGNGQIMLTMIGGFGNIAITGTDSVCRYGTASYVCKAPSATSFTWSGPTGSSVVSGQGTDSATIMFGTTSGNVKVVASATCGSDSTTFSVVVRTPPTVTLAAAKDSVCVTVATDSLTGTPGGGVYSGSGVTGHNFDATVAGAGVHTLTYVFTDTYGCQDSAMAQVVVNLCTGVQEINALNNIKFYPDPFKGTLNVNVATSGDTYLTIFNVLGENVGAYTLKSGANTIDTQSLPSGVYIMQIKNKAGVLNKKLMKVN